MERGRRRPPARVTAIPASGLPGDRIVLDGIGKEYRRAGWVNEAQPVEWAALTSTNPGRGYDWANGGVADDGVTDDAPALREAVERVGQAGGGTVIFHGQPRLVGDVAITHPNVRIVGQGRGSVMAFEDGGLIVDASAGTFKGTDLEQFNITRTGTPGPCLFLNGGTAGGANRIGVRAVRVRGNGKRTAGGSGVRVVRSWLVRFSDVYIQAAEVGWKITSTVATGTSLNAGQIVGGETQGCSVGVEIDSTQKVVFDAHTIEGCATSAIDTYGYNRSLTFKDMYFEANGSTSDDRHIRVGLDGGMVTRRDMGIRLRDLYFQPRPIVAQDHVISLHSGANIIIEGSYTTRSVGELIDNVSDVDVVEGRSIRNDGHHANAPWGGVVAGETATFFDTTP